LDKSVFLLAKFALEYNDPLRKDKIMIRLSIAVTIKITELDPL
jgi:hypothetical protein